MQVTKMRIAYITVNANKPKSQKKAYTTWAHGLLILIALHFEIANEFATLSAFS